MTAPHRDERNVVAEIRAACEAWEPDACLIGNVTAAQVLSVLDTLAAVEGERDSIRRTQDHTIDMLEADLHAVHARAAKAEHERDRNSQLADAAIANATEWEAENERLRQQLAAVEAERDANSQLADAAIDNATRWEAENVALRQQLVAAQRVDRQRVFNVIFDHVCTHGFVPKADELAVALVAALAQQREEVGDG